MSDGSYEALTRMLSLADEDTLVYYSEEEEAMGRVTFNVPTTREEKIRVGEAVRQALGLVKQRKPHGLTRAVRALVARATGHRYPALEKACETLPTEALRDLQRLIQNLQQKATTERNKRRRGQFW